jgi:hypothetical protein
MERRNVTLTVQRPPQEVANIILENGIYVPFSNKPYQRTIKLNTSHLDDVYSGSNVLLILKEYEEYVISSIGSFDTDVDKWFREYSTK